MADDKTKNAGANAADPKIDAIKQLIFGDNMVEYNKRFDTIVSQLEKTKAELVSKLSDQNASLRSEIKELKSELTKAVAALEKSTTKEMARLDDAKTNRKELGKMLQQIADKLTQ